jgi:hypothetical protein
MAGAPRKRQLATKVRRVVKGQQRKCGQASFDHLVGGGEQFIGHGEAERLRGLEVKRMSAAPRRAQARGPGTKPRLLDLGEGFDLHEEIRVGQLRDGDRRTRRRGRAEIVLA